MLSTESRVLYEQPITYAYRFEDETGTNPEELIAAAHAGCFAMALSFALSGAGFPPTELKVDGAVNIEQMTDHWEITFAHLDLTARVPGISEEKFQALAAEAKAGCPVSRALKAIDISLTARLVKE